ncbi:MAG: hypothetical protein JWN82_600 [Candidatus Saccharibacteria bacterium]|nr:hypothetical protein [Candidatus Saccharibacteria bacterium]
MPRHKANTGSGQQLLADFQTAFVSAATIEAAKYEATRSEDELIDHLSAVSSGTYLNPGNLSSDMQADLTRSSLDTHIKKVQARQLDSMNAQQLKQLLDEDRTMYIGRKISVRVLNPRSEAVESVWFDQRAGFRSGTTKKQKITGVVQDVLLDRNALILKPTLSGRLLNTSLENYMVYVIDPDTLMPMVEFTLL